MSETIWTDPGTGLQVDTYVGPAGPPGTKRTRVQIGTADGQFITLSSQEWCVLGDAIIELRKTHSEVSDVFMPSGW